MSVALTQLVAQGFGCTFRHPISTGAAASTVTVYDSFGLSPTFDLMGTCTIAAGAKPADRIRAARIVRRTTPGYRPRHRATSSAVQDRRHVHSERFQRRNNRRRG